MPFIQLCALVLLTFSTSTNNSGIPSNKNIKLSQSNFSQTIGLSFQDIKMNFFILQIDKKMLTEKKHLFFILQGGDLNYRMTFQDLTGNYKQNELMEINTFTGNIIMIMSKNFYDGKLSQFQKTGKIKVLIRNENILESDFKPASLRFEITDTPILQMGASYTTRIDSNIPTISLSFTYNGTAFSEIDRFRFQLTSIHQKKNFSLDCQLRDHQNNNFILNSIFKKTIGGMIHQSIHTICQEAKCDYTLTFTQTGVKLLNIETTIIQKIEVISIMHYEEYYNRVFVDDAITYFELPFEEFMSEMDITISLIPVTGNTGLYANVKTLPTDINNFDWKETGPLAKRITIPWQELLQMNGERQPIYIAVKTYKPGEYLLKVDAHYPGYKGRLNSGIIEAGFVGYQQIINYLYIFEVFESQTIMFDLKLNIVTGDGDLFLQQCQGDNQCQLNSDSISQQSVLKVENHQNTKMIQHSFECKMQKGAVATSCQFVIGILGKENHGTHFEISLQEENYHRLMMPGHSVPLRLQADQIVYLKFSYPSSNQEHKLYFQIESLWGQFDIYASKKQNFPDQQNNQYNLNFKQSKMGASQSLKTIEITPQLFEDNYIQGVYYLAVKALEVCALTLKFYDKANSHATLHTLSAGSQQRGQICGADDIVYFTTKVSLSQEQADSVTISLTPLKGTYTMFGSINGLLPTLNNNDMLSTDNHMELSKQQNGQNVLEYIIGVQLAQDYVNSDNKECYQFSLGLSYLNKPISLTPGILSQYIISNNNHFVIGLTSKMDNLIILKSIFDGYNLKLCANFAQNDTQQFNDTCEYEADGQKVAIFLQNSDILNGCHFDKGEKNCVLLLNLIGNKGQKAIIGYTSNDLPFILIKNNIVNIPIPVGDLHIRFVYHAEKNKPLSLYFNTKGHDVDIFPKLLKCQCNENNNNTFPDINNHDSSAITKKVFIQYIKYPLVSESTYGDHPDLIISISGQKNANKLTGINPNQSVILQTQSDITELHRTQAINVISAQEQWEYYSFYNNGTSDQVRVYVISTESVFIDVMLSKGSQSRPPITGKPLLHKNGLSNIELTVSPIDLQFQKHEKSSLKGHYVLAVKTSLKCQLNIFWNNHSSLNYIEITPNQPTTMNINTQHEFYFAFYAKDLLKGADEKDAIAIYIKTDFEARVYILKSSGELEAPSKNNYKWKTTTGKQGGITQIKIQNTDPDYCLDCLYIGKIQPKGSYGQATIIANIRHHKVPIYIQPGFTFPEVLDTSEEVLLAIHNHDQKKFDVIVQLMNGIVEVFASNDKTVSPNNYQYKLAIDHKKESYGFLNIEPTAQQAFQSTDLYILIRNITSETSSLTLSINIDNQTSNIDIGIQKLVNIGIDQTKKMIFKAGKEDQKLEIRASLLQVIDIKESQQAIKMLPQMVQLYHLDKNGSMYPIQQTKKSFFGNKVYINFEVPNDKENDFIIQIHNYISSFLVLQLDIINGNYHLINLNQFYIDMIIETENLIYEIYSPKQKYLFTDLKICYGGAQIEFFSDDHSDIKNDKTIEYKTEKQDNGELFYIKPEGSKTLLRMKNVKKNELTIYQLSLFGENDISADPYGKLAQGNGGIAHVDTDKRIVTVHPIEAKGDELEGYMHKVEYVLYITDNFKALQYVRNCGEFLLQGLFHNIEMHDNQKVFHYNSLQILRQHKKAVSIQFSNLKENKKYFGIVIANIQMYPMEGGYIQPIKTKRIYYDEFVIITPRFKFPFHFIVTTIICIGVLIVLYFIVSGYIFGQVGKLKSFERLEDLANMNMSVFAQGALDALERDVGGGVKHRNVKKEEESVDVEMTLK